VRLDPAAINLPAAASRALVVRRVNGRRAVRSTGDNRCGYAGPLLHSRRMKRSNLIAATALLAFTACETGYYPAPPPVTGYPRVERHPAPLPPPRQPIPVPPPPPRTFPQPEPWVDVTITTHERQVIQGYVAANLIAEKHPGKGKKPKNLPPGLQKKLDRGGSLPPGWERKFLKGQILPLDVYEQCHPLPNEVMVKLPPQPPGTVIVTIGGKVGRILAATREILDVFEVDY
jgi:hypothetical protein